MFLKRISWPDFEAVWYDRGDGLMAMIGRWSVLIRWWRSWPQFRGKSAPIAGRSGHDRTAIVSHDSRSRVPAAVRWRSSAPESSTRRHNERRSGRLRAIQWRSYGRSRLSVRWRSNAPLQSTRQQVSFPILLMRISIHRPMLSSPIMHSRWIQRRPSDGNRMIAVLPDLEITKNRDRPMNPRPLKHDEVATQIGRFWCLHVSSGKSVDRVHLCDLFKHESLLLAIESDVSRSTTRPAQVRRVGT